MTNERTVLLVVHTGREEATETARRIEKVLYDNNIRLRVLSAEAVDRGPVPLDVRTQLRGRGQDSVAQPVMADHALLVRVGDGPALQCGH